MKAEKIEAAGTAGLDLTKLTSLHRNAYGRSFAPVPPDPARCCKGISGDWGTNQCSRKRGYGPEGAYCKQHDPAAVAIKKAAQTAKWHAEWDARARRDELARLAPAMKAALEAIRAGHNDPRGLAEEVLAKFSH